MMKKIYEKLFLQKQRRKSFQEENTVQIHGTNHSHQTNFPCLVFWIKSGGQRSGKKFSVFITIPNSWYLISIAEAVDVDTGKYLDEIKASDITKAKEEIPTEDGYLGTDTEEYSVDTASTNKESDNSTSPAGSDSVKFL